MPSDFLTPFLELDEEFFCKNFRGLETSSATDGLSYQQQQTRQRSATAAAAAAGFQRRHSLCPVTLPNSKFNYNGGGGGDDSGSEDQHHWGGGLSLGLGVAPVAGQLQRWWGDKEAGLQLPCSSLDRIPFRVDRSVSMIEPGHAATMSGGRLHASLLLPSSSPPPGLGLGLSLGLSLSNASLASSFSAVAGAKPLPPAEQQPPASPPPPMSTRYKTELCRTYEESGTCKYGAKCQFAHGFDEMRGLSRHPKYKTEPCRTFHTAGFCPYGARCHFMHADGGGGNETPTSSSPPGGEEEEGGASPRRTASTSTCRPPLLRHSLSFAGFSSKVFSSSSSSPGVFRPVQQHPPPPPPGYSSSFLFTRASSVSPLSSSSTSSSSSEEEDGSSPELLSPGALFLPEPGVLRRHCPYPFLSFSSSSSSSTGSNGLLLPPVVDLAKDPPCFYASADYANDPKFPAALAATARLVSSPPGLHRAIRNNNQQQRQFLQPLSLQPLSLQAGLQRCSSAESLSEEEGYTSSSSLGSSSSSSGGGGGGSESPNFEGRRLPIFSSLSVSDD